MRMKRANDIIEIKRSQTKKRKNFYTPCLVCSESIIRFYLMTFSFLLLKTLPSLIRRENKMVKIFTKAALARHIWYVQRLSFLIVCHLLMSSWFDRNAPSLRGTISGCLISISNTIVESGFE